MAKKNEVKRSREVRPPRKSGWNDALWITGFVLLGIAAGASLMLAMKHFGGHALPGCGPTSACAQLEASVFGKVPGIEWPTSFLGLAWFAGLLAAWAQSRRGFPGNVVTLARVGAAGSLLFLAVMIGMRKLCPYCLATHAANLAFLAVVERGRGSALPKSSRALISAAVGFALVTAGLAPAEMQRRSAERSRAQQAAARSVAALEQKATPPPKAPPVEPATQAPEPEVPKKDPLPPAPRREEPQQTAPATRTGFTGRYLLGPEKAAYRIVMFTDFGCRDCKRVEGEVLEVLAQRKDMSLSAKNFPMCTDCNERMGKSNLHPNACWAARAAEAAGKLEGNDAYWTMFRWLFDRSGSFTDAEIRAALPGLGYDVERFLAVMQGDESLALVKKDIEEAVELGIQYTPMMFVNGVEFRGWESPGVVRKSLLELPADRPAAGPEGDQPMPAAEKYIEDWRKQAKRPNPPDARPHYLVGGPDAPIQILVFGDYAEENTSKIDYQVRSLVSGRSDVGYAFRHYPANQKCNPGINRIVTPLSCDAARAAEAAFSMGGDAAYRKAHEWLLSREGSLPADFLTALPRALGLDPTAFHESMNDPAASAAITEDVTAASRLGVVGIPQIFIAGKWVPRWFREGDTVLDKILREASQ